MSETQCYCPDCGQPLKRITAYLTKCANGHPWELLVVDGKTTLVQVLDEREDDPEEGGQLEAALCRELN